MSSRSPLWLLALAAALCVALVLEEDHAEAPAAADRELASHGPAVEGRTGLSRAEAAEALQGAAPATSREAPDAAQGDGREALASGDEPVGLAVTVRSALDGRPLEGALLTFTYRHALGRPLEEAPAPLQARADARGLAELRIASGWQGWLDVEASRSACAPGAPAAAGRAIAPLAPGERREADLALDTGSSRGFWLRVADDRGEPLRARLRWTGRGSQGPEVLAGPDGLARLTSAVPEGRRIRIDAPRHAGVEIPPPREEEWDGPPLEVVLQRAGSLRLHLAGAYEQRPLVLEAAPPGSPRVVSQAAPLDAAGRACLGDLPPCIALDLRLVSDGGRLARALPTLTLAPGEERELFVSLPAAAVSGTLRDEHGSALAGCEVRAFRSASLETKLASVATARGSRREEEAADRTRADGSFALEGLARGWWTIAARPEGMGLVTRTLWLEDGESEDLSLVARRGTWIRGRVVERSGRAVADAFVEALASDGSESFWGETDGRGGFLLGPALAEEHTIRALGPWRHAVEARTSARTGAVVELVARRGGGLLAQVRCASSGRPAPATVAVHAGEGPLLARTDAEGRARVEGLEPGCQRVTVTGDDGSFAEATVLVSAGATCEVQLLLRREAGRPPDPPPGDPRPRDPASR